MAASHKIDWILANRGGGWRNDLVPAVPAGMIVGEAPGSIEDAFPGSKRERPIIRILTVALTCLLGVQIILLIIALALAARQWMRCTWTP